MATIYLSKIICHDGKEIAFRENETVIFVGPNNSGKSSVLRDISESLNNPSHNRKAISNALFATNSTYDELLEFLNTRTFRIIRHDNNKTEYYRLNSVIEEDNVRKMWTGGRTGCGEYISHLSHLGGFFLRYLQTALRLMCNSAESLREDQPYTEPHHYLHKYPEIAERISKILVSVFGLGIAVQWRGENEVQVRVVDPEFFSCQTDTSNISSEAFELFPKIEEQGDGVRSFLSILFSVYLLDFSIYIIDEPDAFLHPPQAAALGRLLSDRSDASQVFMATHSGNFLRALLNKANSNVHVIRVTRTGRCSSGLKSLCPDDVRALWGDPILRQSNILDGLFHDEVVICEADSDCRFYGAIIDYLRETEGLDAPDIMFTYCGGKHRIHTVVEALRALGVKTKVIADIDIFREVKIAARVLVASGGDITKTGPLLRSLALEIRERDNPPQLSEVKQAVGRILNCDGDLTEEIASRIRAATKLSTIWKDIKRNGISSAEGYMAELLNEVISAFELDGVFIPRVGELEGFFPELGDEWHGPKFVNRVLEECSLGDARLAEARAFVRGVALAKING